MAREGLFFAVIFFAGSFFQWVWVFFGGGAEKFLNMVNDFYRGQYENKFPYSMCYKPTVVRIFSTIMFCAGILGLIVAIRQ